MTTQRGSYRWDPHQIALRLTEMGDLTTFIGQAVANSIDAGATEIEIFFDRKAESTSYTVHIVDNGSGIVGEIPPEDESWLDLFADEHGKKGVDYNPFTEFKKPTSALSFHTIMKSAGFSVKSVPNAYKKLRQLLDEEGWTLTSFDELQGVYAIGLLEAIGTGSNFQIVSRPCPALSQVHYGTSEGPIFRLTPPTREMFEQRKPEYTIESVDSLKHPRTEEQIEHGTVVSVEDIGDGRSIDIKHLARELNKTFGQFVVKGRIEPITISQRKFRNKHPYTDYETVRGLRIKGDLILRETTHGNSGYRANVTLYDVKKEGNLLGGVRFVRQGALGDLVTSVRGFTGIWTDMRLSGTVEIFVPHDVRESSWNTAKTKPVLRNQEIRDLIQKVIDLEQRISDWFEDTERERERKRLENLGVVLRRKLSKVMAVIPELRDLALVDIKDRNMARSKRRKSAGGDTPQKEGLIVWAVNEYGLRLAPDYVVDLEYRYSSDKMNFDAPNVLRLSRGKGDLGKVKPGYYRLSLKLPPELTMAAGESDTVELLYFKGASVKHVFKVITGEPPRVRDTLKSLRIIFNTLGPEDVHYDATALRDTGILVINADEPALSRAFANNDKTGISWRLAQLVSDAICEIIYEGQSVQTIDEQSRIISGMLAHELVTDWAKAMSSRK